jgi:nicotinamidase-related amidase
VCHSTTLETLLAYLKARTLILTGLTGDICVLFTANDANMRDYRLRIPADCVVSLDPADNARMLDYMRACSRQIPPLRPPSTGHAARAWWLARRSNFGLA